MPISEIKVNKKEQYSLSPRNKKLIPLIPTESNKEMLKNLSNNLKLIATEMDRREQIEA